MRKGIRYILAVGASFVFGALPSFAESPGLTASHQRLLRAVGVPILVPTYVPTGYQLTRVEVRWLSQEGPEYELTWACGNCSLGPMPFTIQGASGGFGGPEGEHQHPVVHTRYGTLTLHEFYSKAQGGHLEAPYPSYLLEWFGTGPLFYSLTTDGEQVAPVLAEIKRVIQSLQPL